MFALVVDPTTHPENSAAKASTDKMFPETGSNVFADQIPIVLFPICGPLIVAAINQRLSKSFDLTAWPLASEPPPLTVNKSAILFSFFWLTTTHLFADVAGVLAVGAGVDDGVATGVLLGVGVGLPEATGVGTAPVSLSLS